MVHSDRNLDDYYSHNRLFPSTWDLILDNLNRLPTVIQASHGEN